MQIDSDGGVTRQGEEGTCVDVELLRDSDGPDAAVRKMVARRIRCSP
jgi:hypothetical protein